MSLPLPLLFVRNGFLLLGRGGTVVSISIEIYKIVSQQANDPAMVLLLLQIEFIS